MPSTMDGYGQRPLNWGARREGAFSTLPRFGAAPRGGIPLVRAYESVLEREETFSQYFSSQNLESYDIEASLREQFGVGPPCLSDPENPSDESDCIISWTTIFRDGDFAEQPDGRYLCHVQGKMVELDESIYQTIMTSRRAFPPSSQAWPVPSDVKRELQLSLEIEADVVTELNAQIKYIERLHQLQLAMKRRRKALKRILNPKAVKVEEETYIPRPLETLYPATMPSRAEESAGSNTIRARSGSEVSGLSSGGDIPSAAAPNDPIPMNMDNSGPSNLGQSKKSTAKTPRTGSHSKQLHSNAKGNPSSANPQHFEREIIPFDDETSSPLTPSISEHVPTSGFLSVNHQQWRAAHNNAHALAMSSSPKRSFEAYDNGDTRDTPNKKRKSTAPTSSVDPEALRYGQQQPMWNIRRQETPQNAQPSVEKPAEPKTTVKPPKGQKKHKQVQKKRERNNFTDFEKEHAPAWIRTALDAGHSGSELQREYLKHFGTHHHATTLKAFLDRQEAKAKAGGTPQGTPQKAPQAAPQATTTPIPNSTPTSITLPAPQGPMPQGPNPGVEEARQSHILKFKETSVRSPMALPSKLGSPSQTTPVPNPSQSGNTTPSSYVSPYTQPDLSKSKSNPVKPVVAQSNASHSGHRASEQPRTLSISHSPEKRSKSAAITKSPFKNGHPST